MNSTEEDTIIQDQEHEYRMKQLDVELKKQELEHKKMELEHKKLEHEYRMKQLEYENRKLIIFLNLSMIQRNEQYGRLHAM